MRFIRPALFAFAVSASSVSANALHQYKPRSFLDTCANVHSEFELSGRVYGRLDICLCVSSIPVHLLTHAALKAAVLIHGKSAVIEKVTSLIGDASDHKKCYYPEHAEPRCDDNPCDFSCEDGFKAYPEDYPTSCVCEYPRTVCNGECGHFEHCGSQKPKKRDSKWRDATCPQGWSACPLWGVSGRDYECVDVTKDLWSCGGCGVPLLPTDPAGIDCTAIPGVLDVSCSESSCVVDRCKTGYRVSPDKATCVSTTRMSPNVPVFMSNNEAGSY